MGNFSSQNEIHGKWKISVFGDTRCAQHSAESKHFLPTELAPWNNPASTITDVEFLHGSEKFYHAKARFRDPNIFRG